MSQTISATETDFPRCRPVEATLKRMRSRHTRRLPPLAAVPDLDWPSDLFADNATMGDLVAEDFPLPPHIAAALFGHHVHTSH